MGESAAAKTENVRSMGEGEKRRFDALAEWTRAEYARIQERRIGEVQITLALWAGLSAMGFGLMTQNKALEAVRQIPAAGWYGAAAILVVFHTRFLYGVAHGHQRNRMRAYGPECEMARMINVDNGAEPRFEFLDWSRQVQLGISVLLAVVVGLLRYYL